MLHATPFHTVRNRKNATSSAAHAHQTHISKTLFSRIKRFAYRATRTRFACQKKKLLEQQKSGISFVHQETIDKPRFFSCARKTCSGWCNSIVKKKERVPAVQVMTERNREDAEQLTWHALPLELQVLILGQLGKWSGIAARVCWAWRVIIAAIAMDIAEVPLRARRHVQSVATAMALLEWARAKGAPWDGRLTAAAAAQGGLGALRLVRPEDGPWDGRTSSAAAGRGDDLEMLRLIQQNALRKLTATTAGQSAVVLPDRRTHVDGRRRSPCSRRRGRIPAVAARACGGY